MRTRRLAAVAFMPSLLLAAASLPAFAGETRPLRPGDIEFPVSDWTPPSAEKIRRVTPGGAAVYFQSVDAQRRVSVEVVLAARDAAVPELPVLWAAAMAEGAPRGADPGAFRRDLDFAEGRILAADRGGAPALVLTASPRGFEKAMSLFQGLLRAPAFAPETVEAARARVLRTWALADGEDAFREAYLYARLATGEAGRPAARLAALGPKDLETFHAEFLHPSRVAVAIAGSMTEKAAVTWAAECFDASARGKPRPAAPPADPKCARGIFVAPAAGPAVRLVAGFPGLPPGPGGPDPAFCLVSVILEGRVMERMRKAVKTPPAPVSALRLDPWRYDVPRFEFTLPLRAALETLKVVLDEAARLAADPPRQEETWAAQGVLLQTPTPFLGEGRAAAGYFAAAEVLWGGPVPETFLREAFLGLGNEELLESAQRMLVPGRFLAVLSGPARELEQGLAELGLKDLVGVPVSRATLQSPLDK
jgi:hypothetical protein